MILKELFLRLGLDLDSAAFAQGMLTANALQAAVTGIAGAAYNALVGLGKMAIGVNADAEATQMKLATIVAMNLKLPFDEAKASAQELFEGLREDAARTPSDTQELVNFATEISNAYLGAGKSVQQLRQFTTQAVVAAKTLGMSGTAGLDIQQAISGQIGLKDRFAVAMIKQLGMTVEQFKSKTMKERVDLLEKSFNSPAINAAMKEFETNWAGVTSTLEDNFKLIVGEAGKPLFNLLKEILLWVGTWVQKNKDKIVKIFLSLWKALTLVVGILRSFVEILAALLGWFFKFDSVIGVIIRSIGLLTAAVVLFGGASMAAGLRAALGWVIAAAPIILLATLIAFIILLIDDIWVGLHGGKSVVFDLFEAWGHFLDEWATPKEGDPWWLTVLRAFLYTILHLSEAWDAAVEYWKGIFIRFADWVKGLFASLWQGIKDGALSALNALNPFSGSFDPQGGGFQSLATTIPSVGPSIARAITISPKVELHVTTTGEPQDAADKIRGVFDDISTVWLREAKEGVK